MDLIHWAYYPSVAQNAHARDWLETQAMLGLAHNTVQAYGRGANDYLTFCERTARPFIEATKADIVAYLLAAPLPGNANVASCGTTNNSPGFLAMMSGIGFLRPRSRSLCATDSCSCLPTMGPYGAVNWWRCKCAISRFPISKLAFGRRLPRMVVDGLSCTEMSHVTCCRHIWRSALRKRSLAASSSAPNPIAIERKP